jgi:hypothetical protein
MIKDGLVKITRSNFFSHKLLLPKPIKKLLTSSDTLLEEDIRISTPN